MRRREPAIVPEPSTPAPSIRRTSPSPAPENVQDYEVGLKSDWSVLDIPLRTNLDGYFSDYHDIQIQTTLPNVTLATAPSAGGGVGPCTQVAYDAGQCVGTSDDNVTLNAKAAHIYGFEWDVTAKPTAQLTLSWAGSYLNAVYTDYTFTPPAGLPSAHRDNKFVRYAVFRSRARRPMRRPPTRWGYAASRTFRSTM